MIKTAHGVRAAHSRAFSFILIAMLCSTVSACGGGGGGASTGGGGNAGGAPPDVEGIDGSGPTNNTYTEFEETTAGRTSVFTTVAINNERATAPTIVGTFDHATGVVSNGQLAGSFEGQQRTTLTLSGPLSSTVLLTNLAGTEYVRFFQTSGTGDDIFGVVGQTTFLDDLPTGGSSRYTGVVVMEVNTEGRYALTGSAVITAKWGSGVDAEFNNLSGTFNEGPQQNVPGAINILGARLEGATFVGDNVTLTGQIFESSGRVDGSIEGQVFGRNADEIGGIFTLESDADDLNISAVFAAE